jgi:hypothetical protein
VASLPVDPSSGQGLLDLDHDGNADPFLDWNRDGLPDYVIGAHQYDTLTGGSQGGAAYLVAGTGMSPEIVREPLRQGSEHPQIYSYLPQRVSEVGDWFGKRLVLLGNARRESQVRFATGTQRDDGFRGSVAVLRPPLLHFDDDTFYPPTDGIGTSRVLTLDFGPAHRRRTFYLLGSSTGTYPGQTVLGYAIPLNHDGPGGLWERTFSGAAAGSPLAFSQLTGRLDWSGRAQITITVTGPTAGHPWFSQFRHHYTAIVIKPGTSSVLEDMSAPVPLFVF